MLFDHSDQNLSVFSYAIRKADIYLVWTLYSNLR